jgi:hypothetical protein
MANRIASCIAPAIVYSLVGASADERLGVCGKLAAGEAGGSCFGWEAWKGLVASSRASCSTVAFGWCAAFHSA